MEPWIFNLLIVLASFFMMECVAWLAHKYIMHGLLWSLHHDHHKRDDGNFFEKNDFFFLIFAIPGIICLFVGLSQGYSYPFWIGIGITLYGLAYFLVHDIFIHQRFKMFRNSNSIYLLALRRAHKSHHKHLDKHDGECFGMLWVPIKYLKEAKKTVRQ
ncbi:MAG: fatty acid hydroxylase [Sphingobacteriaceae bacterium]|jgi:beta-carotene 3-hydroxylase|nr:fatty acid hydroxylase [Sphingobacteriaceae bacterium]